MSKSLTEWRDETINHRRIHFQTKMWYNFHNIWNACLIIYGIDAIVMGVLNRFYHDISAHNQNK